MSKPSWIGVTLKGRYRIESLLGQGGMSAVYKATDPNLRRVVAIKLIHAHLASDQQFVARFEEEATAIAQLRHPNIVQVYDFDHDEDTYYIVLEFIPGETLNDRLKRLNQAKRFLPLAEALQIIIQICEAVDYAHKRGLVHRDIKPANIMLNVQQQAILTDFGIVKILGGEKHTATGAVLGTALYMSPEQVRGEMAEPRSDIYSLGVTLFEMLSGNPPFQADSVMTVLMMHLTDPVPDLRSLRAEVPAEVVAIIEKAMAKDARQRYQTAAEMATALRAALAHCSTAPEVSQPTPDETKTLIEETHSTLLDAPARQESIPATELDRGAPGAALPQNPNPEPTPQRPAAAKAAELGDTGPMPQVRLPQADARQTDRAAAPIKRSPEAVQSQNAVKSPPISGVAARPAAQTSGNAPAFANPIGTIKAAPWLLLAGGLGAAVVIGVVILAIVFRLAASRATPAETEQLTSPLTQTPPGLVAAPATREASPTSSPQTPALAIAAATTQTPTATNMPTLTPTLPPTQMPTATVPPGILYVRINAITIDANNRYVVEYETFEFTEKLPGVHIHFFFDTVPPEQAGVPGSGPWILYGGPRPFTGYAVSDRPANAARMCALVANPNHSVQQGTGNCLALP